MAQVPYNPDPGALEPAGRPEVEGPRVDTPGAAFGTVIGEAVQRGGQQVGQVGNELFARALQIQDLNNENKARETSIAATQEMAQRFEQFDSLEGQARHDAFPGMLKDINDIRTKYRAGLNPMAARMYDADAANLQNRFTVIGATRAAASLKEAAIKNAQAGVDLESRPYIDPFNDTEFNSRMESIKSKLAPMMRPDVGGWTQAQFDDAVLKETTKQRTVQIQGQALRDPQRAFDTYDRALANKEISGPEANELLKDIQARNREIIGNGIAKAIFKEGGSLEEMEAKAEARAPASSHGDASFTKSVINDLRGLQIIEDQAARQQKRTDEQTVVDRIHSTNPQSATELLSDPDTMAAYQRAQAHGAFKDGVQGMVQKNIDDRMNQQNVANYNYWYGMGLDPTRRSEFLDRTATGLHDVIMDKDQRKAIMGLRKQLITNQILDKRIAPALKALADGHYEEMRTLGVLHPPPKDADDSIVQNYSDFLVSLQEALDAYAAKSGGNPPGPEEFDKLIAKPLLQSHSVKGWVWTSQEGSWVLPKEVIDAARESMGAEATAMGMPIDFSEREVRREAVRKLWKEHFQGSSGGGSTSE